MGRMRHHVESCHRDTHLKAQESHGEAVKHGE